MVASRLRLSSLPPIGGMALGLFTAAAVGVMPAGWIERAVDASGIASLLPAARPPLGLTARLLLGGASGFFTGATGWAALYLLFGPGGSFAREGGEDGMPTVRRADAHPDAPPRRPLAAAAELGTPPPPIAPPAAPEAPVERPLPADLDRPLSEYDPAAMRLEPMEPGRPVPPLAIKREPLAPGERIESVELPAAPDAESVSIEGLLARLEKGTLRRQRLRRAG